MNRPIVFDTPVGICRNSVYQYYIHTSISIGIQTHHAVKVAPLLECVVGLGKRLSRGRVNNFRSVNNACYENIHSNC